ncbi:MAG TPA: hypothetical protein VF921_12915 [Vicinamibacterales bacterium]
MQPTVRTTVPSWTSSPSDVVLNPVARIGSRSAGNVSWLPNVNGVGKGIGGRLQVLNVT